MKNLLTIAAMAHGMGNYSIPHLIEKANPIFIPKKHTVMSYRAQQRLAKKRKNKR